MFCNTINYIIKNIFFHFYFTYKLHIIHISFLLEMRYFLFCIFLMLIINTQLLIKAGQSIYLICYVFCIFLTVNFCCIRFISFALETTGGSVFVMTIADYPNMFTMTRGKKTTSMKDERSQYNNNI